MLTSKQFWLAAFERAVKTFAQTLIALIGVGAAITQVNWVVDLSAAGTAALLSLLTSLTSISPVAPAPEKAPEGPASTVTYITPPTPPAA